MREIKFRAWDISAEKMITDGLDFELNLLDIDLGDHNPWSGIGYPSYYDKYFKIMQFTGRKDSDGVDIYERDIVQFTWWWFDGSQRESLLTGEIVYSNENMSFQLKGVKNKEWERHTGYENDSDYLTPFSELNFEEADFSVIGNIHTTPELLQVES